MHILLIYIIFIGLQACSNTPPPQFYTLDATLKPVKEAHRKLSKQQTIGIGPVTIPTVLNRKAIVTRGTHQSIQVSETQQWAEPLLDNITRVISQNITTLQPNLILHSYPWTAFGAVDTRVVIEITRFEALPGKNVYFDAVWAIKNEAQEKAIRQGHSTLERALKSTDTAEVVAQMNSILEEYSTEIANALTHQVPNQ